MTGKRITLLILGFFLSGFLWFFIFIIPVDRKYDLFSFIKLKIHEGEQFHIYESKQNHALKHKTKKKRRDVQRDKVLKSFSSQFADD